MKPEKAIELALDAEIRSTKDVAAARGVTVAAVRAAKKQVRDDPDFRRRRQEMSNELHASRVAFLKAALSRLRERLAMMDDPDLVMAYKAIAEHHEVAFDEHPSAPQEHPKAPAGEEIEYINYGAKSPQ